MYDINNKLNKAILFEGKSSNEIDTLLSNLTYAILSFKKNEVIFSSNKVCDRIGIILSGTVIIRKFLVSGESLIIGEKKENNLIGIKSIFLDLEYYPFLITAKENTNILLINKNDFINFVLSNKEIMYNFIKAISCDMNLLNNKVDFLSQTSIKNKIVYYLVSEYDKHNSLTIKLPFSKKEWAEFLNIQTPSLSRVLSQMEKEGLIKNKNRIFYLLDIDKLREILY